MITIWRKAGEFTPIGVDRPEESRHGRKSVSFFPQMRVVTLAPFVRTLEQMGVEMDPLLGRAGLPNPEECDGNALISSTAVFRFLEDAARKGGADGFGLQAGSQTQPEHFGWYGRLLLHSHTAAELLIRSPWLVRALHSGQLIWAEPCGDHVRVCATFVDCLQQGRREAEYFVLGTTINTIRLFAGRDWRPTEVQLEATPDRKLAQHEALSEARILFRRPCTSILLPRAVLSRPVPTSRRDAPEYQAMLQARFLETAPALENLNAVRQTVRALLSQGTPAIEQAAEALAVSPRTLQRRLTANALTYSRLLDQVRFERARELLADPTVPAVEVAFELAYTDQSNFSRAFRRWAGVSPGAYRQALLHDGPGISAVPEAATAAAC
jgi:AraC-like DNA-binding protein